MWRAPRAKHGSSRWHGMERKVTVRHQKVAVVSTPAVVVASGVRVCHAAHMARTMAQCASTRKQARKHPVHGARGNMNGTRHCRHKKAHVLAQVLLYPPECQLRILLCVHCFERAAVHESCTLHLSVRVFHTHAHTLTRACSGTPSGRTHAKGSALPRAEATVVVWLQLVLHKTASTSG